MELSNGLQMNSGVNRRWLSAWRDDSSIETHDLQRWRHWSFCIGVNATDALDTELYEQLIGQTIQASLLVLLFHATWTV